jgi:hypothetical protein
MRSRMSIGSRRARIKTRTVVAVMTAAIRAARRPNRIFARP